MDFALNVIILVSGIVGSLASVTLNCRKLSALTNEEMKKVETTETVTEPTTQSEEV